MIGRHGNGTTQVITGHNVIAKPTTVPLMMNETTRRFASRRKVALVNANGITKHTPTMPLIAP